MSASSFKNQFNTSNYNVCASCQQIWMEALSLSGFVSWWYSKTQQVSLNYSLSELEPSIAKCKTPHPFLDNSSPVSALFATPPISTSFDPLLPECPNSNLPQIKYSQSNSPAYQSVIAFGRQVLEAWNPLLVSKCKPYLLTQFCCVNTQNADHKASHFNAAESCLDSLSNQGLSAQHQCHFLDSLCHQLLQIQSSSFRQQCWSEIYQHLEMSFSSLENFRILMDSVIDLSSPLNRWLLAYHTHHHLNFYNSWLHLHSLWEKIQRTYEWDAYCYHVHVLPNLPHSYMENSEFQDVNQEPDVNATSVRTSIRNHNRVTPETPQNHPTENKKITILGGFHPQSTEFSRRHAAMNTQKDLNSDLNTSIEKGNLYHTCKMLANSMGRLSYNEVESWIKKLAKSFKGKKIKGVSESTWERTKHEIKMMNLMAHNMFDQAAESALLFNQSRNSSYMQKNYRSDLQNAYNITSNTAHILNAQQTYLDLFSIYSEAGLLEEAEFQCWLGYQFSDSYYSESIYALNSSRIYFEMGDVGSSFNQLMWCVHRACNAIVLQEVIPACTVLSHAVLQISLLLVCYPVLAHHLTIDPIELQTKVRQFCMASEKSRNSKENVGQTFLGFVNDLSSETVEHPLQIDSVIVNSSTQPELNIMSKKKDTFFFEKGQVCTYVVTYPEPDVIASHVRLAKEQNSKTQTSALSNGHNSAPNGQSSPDLLLNLASPPIEYVDIAKAFCDVADVCGDLIILNSGKKLAGTMPSNNCINAPHGGQIKTRAAAFRRIINLWGNGIFTDSRLLTSWLKDMLLLPVEWNDTKDIGLFLEVILRYIQLNPDVESDLSTVSDMVYSIIPQSERIWKYWKSKAAMDSLLRTKQSAAALAAGMSGYKNYKLNSSSPKHEMQLNEKTRLGARSMNRFMKNTISHLISTLSAPSFTPLPNFLTKCLHYDSSQKDIELQFSQACNLFIKYPISALQMGDRCLLMLRMIDGQMEIKASRFNYPLPLVRIPILECMELANRLRLDQLYLAACMRLCLLNIRQKELRLAMRLLPKISCLAHSLNASSNICADLHYMYAKIIVSSASRTMIATATEKCQFSQITLTPASIPSSIRPLQQKCTSFPISSPQITSSKLEQYSGRFTHDKKEMISTRKLNVVGTPKKEQQSSPRASKTRDSRNSIVFTPPSAMRQRKKHRSRQASVASDRTSIINSSEIGPLNIQTTRNLLQGALHHVLKCLELWSVHGQSIGVPSGVQQQYRLQEMLFMRTTLQKIENTTIKGRDSNDVNLI